MSILSKLGVSAATIGILFVAFTICIYAIIGWLSRTMQLDAYYVAGREVPALYNGMATAADWMSGASFVALAGGIYFGGYGYMAFVVGWTGGYVLVNALMAPYLRKFGCYTVPDFIGTRYGGNIARFCAVVVLVVASFTYVTAQINASGTIAARALQIPFGVGIWVGLVAILMCSMLGGMRAVTWTQVAQYIVLIIAYLTPVIWMSNVQGFGIIPHFDYGGAVHRIQELEPVVKLGVAATESFKGLRILSTPINATGAPLESWKFATLGLLHDGRHGVLAAHPDALLHDPVGARGAQVGGHSRCCSSSCCTSPRPAWRRWSSCSCSIRICRPPSSASRLPRWPIWRGSRTGRPLACCIFPTAIKTESCSSTSSSCGRISSCWQRRKWPACHT